MKKRRTRAQIAATKKLVAFNKKRRGKKVAKKKGRKKRRTAKQIAATRKLVALNKRRGKKRTVKRKVRRRNPKRKVAKKSAQSHLFVIFKCRGKSVMFLGLSSTGANWVWKSSRADALLSKSRKIATSIAKGIVKQRGLSKFQVGVSNYENTAAQIAAQCGGKT